jgi:hypothetical protein
MTGAKSVPQLKVMLTAFFQNACPTFKHSNAARRLCYFSNYAAGHYNLGMGNTGETLMLLLLGVRHVAEPIVS